MKLLLLSNSTMQGSPYLEWPQPYLEDYLKGIDEILFVPFAAITIGYDAYTESVADALAPTSTRVRGIHSEEDKILAVKRAQCIVVGGGNTFQLLASLQNENLIAAIRDSVSNGVPYIGWSAGSNIVCPTIMTTNDMPVIEPDSFEALNLINFQINAHYTKNTIIGHGGESRDLRIKEFLTVNNKSSVVGLPEGKLLELDGDAWYLRGIESEKTLLFHAGLETEILETGSVKL